MTVIELVGELRRMIPQNGETQTKWNETMALCDAIVDRAWWEGCDQYIAGLKEGTGKKNDLTDGMAGTEVGHGKEAYPLVEK